MKKILLIIGLTAIVACKKDTDTTIGTAQDTLPKTETTTAVQADSLEIYVTQINTNRNSALASLKSASAEKANALYDNLVTENDKVLGKINNLEAGLLDSFYEHFSGQYTDVPDATVKSKEKVLGKGQLEFWDVGEGMAVIRTKADYYKNIFAGKLTDDYNQYVTLLAEDEKDLWQADAGVSISWEALGQRVINWENFVTTYPHSKLKKYASYDYELYRYAFLVGLDNTPAVDRQTKEMTDETRTAFKNFAEKYPTSPTTRLVKLLLEDPNNIENVVNEVRVDF